VILVTLLRFGIL